MIAFLFRPRESFTVPCTVELEHTPEFMQANVDLKGIEVNVGDTVQVHDAPTGVAFGDHQFFERTATVTRANALDKFLTKISAYLELTGLYETGFDADFFGGKTTIGGWGVRREA
jgi:hypothetical protein